jgi:hypothetical protein
MSEKRKPQLFYALTQSFSNFCLFLVRYGLMSEKEKKLAYFVFGVVIVAILVIGLFRQSIFVFGHTGRVVIDHLEANTVIYIDKIESGRSGVKAEDDYNLGRIGVGSRQILILRNGFWPWLKEVEIKKGEKIVLSPFSAPENSSGFLIGESDSEYEALVAEFDATTAPDVDNKKISKDQKIAVWIDENKIFAEWLGEEGQMPEAFCNKEGCSFIIEPLTVGGSIRNVDFYKDRSDVITVAFGSGVFAVELNNNGHQNFQPLFEGDVPQFLVKDEKAIYILDGEVLREISL